MGAVRPDPHNGYPFRAPDPLMEKLGTGPNFISVIGNWQKFGPVPNFLPNFLQFLPPEGFRRQVISALDGDQKHYAGERR